MANCRRLLAQYVRRADSRHTCTAGSSSAIKKPDDGNGHQKFQDREGAGGPEVCRRAAATAEITSFVIGDITALPSIAAWSFSVGRKTRGAAVRAPSPRESTHFSHRLLISVDLRFFAAGAGDQIGKHPDADAFD